MPVCGISKRHKARGTGHKAGKLKHLILFHPEPFGPELTAEGLCRREPRNGRKAP
jgi:hypothetical protein